MARKPATISQLNDYIQKTIKLDPILGNVYAIGTISDLKYHTSGHIYFSAIDDDSKIRCMIPSYYAKYLEIKLENGNEVIMTGFIDVYKKGGSYSLMIKEIEIQGEGKSSLEFQYLLNKLKSEGLFDPELKKPIPTFPKKIGVITASTGAALQDILKIIQARNNYVDVLIFPTQVQGDNAAVDLTNTVKFVNENYKDLDTVIIGRGGGSQEDLIPFNDENLARAIASSEIPIISAVGHEIDFTICDFVADLRAETPTAAAQIAVPDISQIREDMEKLKNNLSVSFNHLIEYSTLQAKNQKDRLQMLFDNMIERYKNEIQSYKLKLEANNPYEILKKGYDILIDNSNQPVISVKNVNIDETYELIMNDGKIKVKILEVE